jgi:hypothetical protein
MIFCMMSCSAKLNDVALKMIEMNKRVGYD